MIDDPKATEWLKKARAGDESSSAAFGQVVYDKLRRIAAGYMRRERRDHTLQPTALVHEAYIQLIDPSVTDWNDRSHFVGVAARAMRRVLVEHARRRNALKRGGDRHRVPLEDSLSLSEVLPLELMDLEEKLCTLERVDSRKARIVELRFFGGLTCQEIGDQLGVSLRTVEDDWYAARAWLRRELSQGLGNQ